MKYIISVDVEALPHRSDADHVDLLIWGRYNSSEYGIRRLCEIFDKFKIVGVFFVDIPECLFYGDEKYKEIIDTIFSLGHIVELHCHSEIYTRLRKPKHSLYYNKDFSKLDYHTSLEVLEWSACKFYEISGRDPRCFRAGSFLINRETIDAVNSLNIPISSNYVNGYKVYSNLYGNNLSEIITQNADIFSWSGKCFEIPVDVPIPELTLENANSTINYISNIIQRNINLNKKEFVINLVLHSWSLFIRNPDGYHKEYNQQFENSLFILLDYLSRIGVNTNYTDFSSNYSIESGEKIVDYSIIKSFSNYFQSFQKEGMDLVLHDLVIGKDMMWFEVPHVNCQELRIELVILSLDNEKENSALISPHCIDDINTLSSTPFVFSDDADIGYYSYLNTTPISSSTVVDIKLNSANGVFRFRVKSWYSKGILTLKEMRIKFIANISSENTDSLSVPNYIDINQLPVLLRLADFSKYNSLYCHRVGDKFFQMVVSENIVELLSFRDFISYDEIVSLLNYIKSELADISIFKISGVFVENYGDFKFNPRFSIKSQSYILDLPQTKFIYDNTIISKRLLSDMNKEMKKLKGNFSDVNISISISDSLDSEFLLQCGDLIDSHLKRKTNMSTLDWSSRDSFDLNMKNYINSGVVISIKSGKQLLAATVGLIDRNTRDLHFIAAGYRDDLTKLSIGKICLYEFIMFSINSKFRRVVMGSGDFGYKSRFGAQEVPVFDIEFVLSEI